MNEIITVESEKKNLSVLSDKIDSLEQTQTPKICIFIPTTTEYRNAKRIFFTLDKAKIATLAPGL